MTEPSLPAAEPKDDWFGASPNNAKLVYILYLVAFAVGLTALVGVVFAYMSRGRAEGWLQSHYTYLIRTFWIGLLYSFLALILAVILIGFLLMIAVAIWWVVRCVKGLQALSRGEAIGNPQSWLI
jgi:uncharacterized membrane protein